MKRVLNLVCKNEDLAAEIKITVKGDGSNYRSDKLTTEIHRFFDGVVDNIHNHFYYDEIKIKGK